MNKYYNEIAKALQSYENYKPYHTKNIEWISNRISWCWKWRKITEEQMEELCDRVIKVLKGD
jgi:hypothetical protein